MSAGSRWSAQRAGAQRARAPRWLALQRRHWGAAALCLASACGPAVPAREPEPASPPEASAEAAPAEASAPPSLDAPTAPAAAAAEQAVDDEGADELDADIAALSKATKGPEDKSEGSSGREVVYRVTPQGLVIELGGIHVRPTVKAFRDAKGNYGVELQLTVESFDGRQYWLSKPEEGPLSIAGRLEAPSGKRQRFGDERRGDDEEVIRAGEPRQFKQRWPGKGQPKLRAGETLTLEVGLWGVHADSERERPVRRLFEVKLLGAQPPQAVVSPPTLDWGS